MVREFRELWLVEFGWCAVRCEIREGSKAIFIRNVAGDPVNGRTVAEILLKADIRGETWPLAVPVGRLLWPEDEAGSMSELESRFLFSRNPEELEAAGRRFWDHSAK